MFDLGLSSVVNPWQLHRMAVDDVQQRFQRITAALCEAGVPHAIVGGQAVAAWVSTKDPDAVRVTKDVDILLDRKDLPQARAAALALGMDYFEVVGVGMFLEHDNPNPRRAVHLLWAGEKVRPEYETIAATIDQRELLAPGLWVVMLSELVRMKLQANRDQDRVHLRDMIDVGLIGREIMETLPPSLAQRLLPLLVNAGR
jgi:hypothetical protein